MRRIEWAVAGLFIAGCATAPTVAPRAADEELYLTTSPQETTRILTGLMAARDEPLADQRATDADTVLTFHAKPGQPGTEGLGASMVHYARLVPEAAGTKVELFGEQMEDGAALCAPNRPAWVYADCRPGPSDTHATRAVIDGLVSELDKQGLRGQAPLMVKPPAPPPGLCNPESEPGWASATAIQKHELYERCHPAEAGDRGGI